MCSPDTDTKVNIITAMIMKQQFPPDLMLLSGNWSVYGGGLHLYVCACVQILGVCVERWAAVFGQLTVECDR